MVSRHKHINLRVTSASGRPYCCIAVVCVVRTHERGGAADEPWATLKVAISVCVRAQRGLECRTSVTVAAVGHEMRDAIRRRIGVHRALVLWGSKPRR